MSRLEQVLLFAFALSACIPNTARAMTYGAELQTCTASAREKYPNDNALACESSIACENDVRARYGRPLRDASKGCQ